MRPALLIIALCLLLPAVAEGGTRERIVDDCADDGLVQGTYTAAALRDARRNLPTEAAEYTDCADQIRRAELAVLEAMRRVDRPGSAPAGAPVARPAVPLTPATDAERRSLVAAAEAAPRPVEVAGMKMVPGAAGFAPAAPRNAMPLPLLLVTAGLFAACLGAFTVRLRRPRM